MSLISPSQPNPGWNFDNTYNRLNSKLFSELPPVRVSKPSIFLFNDKLAQQLDLDFSAFSQSELAALFSGNQLPPGSNPIAQAYAGHQFGHFTMLGDGRAILIGEHLDKKKQRWDIQLKGSGRTPYSRGGDGRATLKSMLREYLISEAVHHLGIPGSRSLAVCLTGENLQREVEHKGAVLCRVSRSHLRVGTIEFVRNFLPIEELSKFCEYAIGRHYPELLETSNPPLQLLKTVMEKQTDLIVNWMRVGFIHGVMNTDNTSLAGETIDYGPCAFMNAYDPNTVFSSIDRNGRYAFANQAPVIQWNMAALAGALIPIVDKDENLAVEQVKSVINSFPELYQEKYLKMMGNKLGMTISNQDDYLIMIELLQWMEKNKADYTNTFRQLTHSQSLGEIYEDEEFKIWKTKWEERIEKEELSTDRMQTANPSIIPRNHIVEEVLDKAAFEDKIDPLLDLIDVIQNPYNKLSEDSPYGKLPTRGDSNYQTYCGT